MRSGVLGWGPAWWGHDRLAQRSAEKTVKMSFREDSEDEQDVGDLPRSHLLGESSTEVLDGASHAVKAQEAEGHTGWVRSAAAFRDGTSVATVADDKTAIIWHAATGQVLRKLLGHVAGVL